MRVASVSLVMLLVLSGCGGGSSSGGSTEPPPPVWPDEPPVTDGAWYKPPLFATWQWQLMGEVNTAYDVDIYDIDLFDSPATLIEQLQDNGVKVICYFSAGSYEEWRPDADSFAPEVIGKTLDGWNDERWLDIRAANVRTIMESRLDLAVEKHCDGVEPDNMDGYTNNPGFPLTAQDQVSYNRFIANAAHARGLSVGLKNDLDQIAELVDYYDFAVNEQCFQYNECDALQPFTDQSKPVLNAEYKSKYVANAIERDALCVDSKNRLFSTLILPLDLDDAFRFSCL